MHKYWQPENKFLGDLKTSSAINRSFDGSVTPIQIDFTNYVNGIYGGTTNHLISHLHEKIIDLNYLTSVSPVVPHNGIHHLLSDKKLRAVVLPGYEKLLN